MKIRMLGTGYGECKIKKRVSKDYRGRGGVVIDDFLLIDAPDDIFKAAEELGFSDIFRTISDVLITHSHAGHFSARVIDKMAKKRRIRVYASREVLVQIGDNPNITKYEICAFMKFGVGGYNVVALPASHSTDILTEECFNFLLLGDRRLLYALDGGFTELGAFNVLRQVTLDAVICDTALGKGELGERAFYHNDIYTLARIKALLEKCGAATEKTRFILSHIPTDKKISIHDELSPVAAEYGMTLAYDGYFARI